MKRDEDAAIAAVKILRYCLKNESPTNAVPGRKWLSIGISERTMYLYHDADNKWLYTTINNLRKDIPAIKGVTFHKNMWGTPIQVKGDKEKILANIENYLKKITGKRFTLLPGLPKDFRWGDVLISFVGPQSIQISVRKKLIGKYDADMLGFYKATTASKTPDAQWKLLRLFANLLQLSDGLPVTGIRNALKLKNNTAVHQIKKNLGHALREIFGLDDDPISSYKSDPRGGIYKPRFQLRPEPELREEKLRRSGMSFNEELEYETPLGDKD
ncbi:MAG: hypothetical protein ABSE76_01445 [Minisyncoccia bacterium]|jgi:hypothetical protein